MWNFMGNIGNVNAKDPDYWNVTDDPGIRNTDWMGRVNQNIHISALSIPGTHDSMARTGVLHVWCQSLSLYLQLQTGIRFFDLRCRHFNNSLPIHHAQFYQNCDFKDCIREMISFLDQNPSEILLVRVKEEHKAENNTETFSQTVQRIMNEFPIHRFWLENRIPKIQEGKGKIVILRNFSHEGSDLGINYHDLKIADLWNVNAGDTKWKNVRDNLEKSRDVPDESKDLFLTYNSASGGGAAPREIARSMNTRLHSYVCDTRARSPRGRMGIIAMDYPGPKLIQDIINFNYH